MIADTADPDLAVWLAQRDTEAFRRLVERHAGLVAAACRRQLGPTQDAEDAAQAVFIVLGQRAASLRPGAPLAPWLCGVALRVCQKARRAAARRTRHEHEAAMASAQHSADTAPRWEDVRSRLDEALAHLGGGIREAVIGHYLEGLPQAAVASRLGISEEATRKRLQSAREQLRRWFARRGLTVGAGVLAAGLASEAPAAEPLLVQSCVQAGLHPSGTAAALAASGGGALSTAAIAAVLCGVLAAGSALYAVLSPRAQMGDPPPTPAAQAEQPGPLLARQLATRIDVMYRRDFLGEVLSDLDDQVGLDSAVPPALQRGALFSYEATDVTVQAVLERLASEQGLRLAYHHDTVALWKPADDAVIAELTRKTRDTDLGARLEAVYDLGQLADPRIYPPLFSALADAEVAVARKALDVVDRHAPSLRCQRLAPVPVATLIAAWETRDTGRLLAFDTDRYRALRILGHSREPQAVTWLIGQAADGDPSFRNPTVDALGLSRSPQAVPTLFVLDDRPKIGWQTSSHIDKALSAIGDAQVAAACIASWKRQGPSERIAIRLERLRGTDIIDIMWPKDADEPDQGFGLSAATNGLRRNRDPRIAAFLVRTMRESTDTTLQRHASEALGRFRDRHVSDQLWTLAQSTGDTGLRKRCLSILAMQRDARVIPGQRTMLDQGMPEQLRQTAQRLSRYRDPTINRELLLRSSRSMSTDWIDWIDPLDLDWHDPQVTAMVIQHIKVLDQTRLGLVLRRLCDGTCPLGASHLIGLLSDPNPFTRQFAVIGLFSQGDPRHVVRLAALVDDPLYVRADYLFWIGCRTRDPRVKGSMMSLLDPARLKAGVLPVGGSTHGGDGPDLLSQPRIQERLLQMLSSDDASVRRSAAGWLVPIATPSIANALVERLQLTDWTQVAFDFRLSSLFSTFLATYPEAKARHAAAVAASKTDSPPATGGF